MGLFDADDILDDMVRYDDMLKLKKSIDRTLLRELWTRAGYQLRWVYLTKTGEEYFAWDLIDRCIYNYSMDGPGFEPYRTINVEATIDNVIQALNTLEHPAFIIVLEDISETKDQIIQGLEKHYGEVWNFFKRCKTEGYGIIKRRRRIRRVS